MTASGENKGELGEIRCKFCAIIRGEPAAEIIFSDGISLAFLDHRPLFPGHTLLVPIAHLPTLGDLPENFTGHFFRNARLLALAVEEGMAAEGTFVAINNRVSQSVPHLHVHIVPRRRHDGLKGFFWPRHPYSDQAEIDLTAGKIRNAIRRITEKGGE